MSEMIERVANAIEDASDGLVIHSGERLARAAIRAMLEPTETMLEAALVATREQGAPDTSGGAAYRAAISAALT